MADDKSGDLIDAIQRDHREVERMISAVESTSGDAKRRAFEQLAAKLRAHERAEQRVVHPLAVDEGNTQEAQTLEKEEATASGVLGELEGVDVDSAEFDSGFARLRADVIAHAQEEEREEHPRLARDTPADELERRKKMFEDAEREGSQ